MRAAQCGSAKCKVQNAKCKMAHSRRAPGYSLSLSRIICGIARGGPNPAASLDSHNGNSIKDCWEKTLVSQESLQTGLAITLPTGGRATLSNWPKFPRTQCFFRLSLSGGPYYKLIMRLQPPRAFPGKSGRAIRFEHRSRWVCGNPG